MTEKGPAPSEPDPVTKTLSPEAHPYYEHLQHLPEYDELNKSLSRKVLRDKTNDQGETSFQSQSSISMNSKTLESQTPTDSAFEEIFDP